jgi:hypothetical protein
MYLTKLSVSQITAHSNDGWVTSKLVERGRGLIKVILQHIPRETEENNEPGSWTARGKADIRIRHYPNTNQVRYHYTPIRSTKLCDNDNYWRVVFEIAAMCTVSGNV